MKLNEEIWDAINATPKMPEEVKKSLLVTILRLIEKSQATPVGQKLGVTIMTQEASLGADRVVSGGRKPLPGDAKPKTI